MAPAKARINDLLWRAPFIIVFLSVAVGIVVDRYLAIAIVQLIAAAVCVLVSWFTIVTKRKRIAFAALFVATGLLFGYWHHLQWRIYSCDEVARYLTSTSDESIPIRVQGTVVEPPTVRRAGPADPLSTMPVSDRTVTELQIRRVNVQGTWQLASGKVELTVQGHVVGLMAGDRVEVLGELQRPRRAKNPGERDFRQMKRSQRILCLLRSPYPDCVSILPRIEQWWSLRTMSRWLHRIRGNCHIAIQQHVHPNAELAKAILLGTKDGVDLETIDAFFLTGTMHLLAISGLHVSILAGVFFLVAKRGMISHTVALGTVMVLIFGYALLTGARPPVIRSMILVQVFCVSWMFRRRANAINSIAASAVLVLLLNPCDLFQVGAQLSFVAVVSLSWFAVRPPQVPSDPLERLIWRTRSLPARTTDATRNIIRTSIIASLVVWLACLPLVAHHFHVAAPVSIVLTLVLAIPVMLALCFGAITMALAPIWPLAASVTGAVCGASLSTMYRIVELALPLPGSHFWIPSYGPFWTLAFYAVASLIGTRVVRLSRIGRFAALLAWFALPIVFDTAKRLSVEQPLEVTFISVGHGVSVLLQFPSGRTALYDCGHMGIPNGCVDSISSVLWHKGIHRIDTVVLSHADADHYNALPGLMERFQLSSVVVTEYMFQSDSDALAELKRSIDRANVTLQTVHCNQRMFVDPAARCDVLHPLPSTKYSSDNAASIVLHVANNQHSILLTGDLERGGLTEVMQRVNAKPDVVMVPHHGSRNSDPERYSSWAAAPFAVISAGEQSENELARANGAYSRFGELFHTEQHGAITFTFENDRIEVTQFLPDAKRSR
ncbi:MAG: ComEC/Rec2 family competence protein [Planctomycetales bacterium]|nr:ComEC/Rec2 family competence protein [Planctomycetales bacterium]